MSSPVPRWFTIVAVVALLWNLLGCAAFASDLMITPADLATLSPDQQAMYAARPAWGLAATGLAVIGGALGCIGLLLRKRWSVPLFALSLAGIVAQEFGIFVLADGARTAGAAAAILQGIVVLVGIGLLLLARRASARGWLA